ncbi:MAG: thioredoxin [Clostridia bacterium]
MAQIIKNDEFKAMVLKNTKPVLVDFFATWCGPCKMLAPILESAAKELGDSCDIFKMDIDENMELAREYGIMSVPTMIVFKNGEIKEKLVGLRQKNQIVEMLKNI